MRPSHQNPDADPHGAGSEAMRLVARGMDKIDEPDIGEPLPRHPAGRLRSHLEIDFMENSTLSVRGEVAEANRFVRRWVRRALIAGMAVVGLAIAVGVMAGVFAGMML